MARAMKTWIRTSATTSFATRSVRPTIATSSSSITLAVTTASSTTCTSARRGQKKIEEPPVPLFLTRDGRRSRGFPISSRELTMVLAKWTVNTPSTRKGDNNAHTNSTPRCGARRGGGAVVRGRPARHRPSGRYGAHPGYHRQEPGRHGAATARDICRERLAGSSENASDDAAGRNPHRHDLEAAARPARRRCDHPDSVHQRLGRDHRYAHVRWGPRQPGARGELCEFVDGPEG